MAGERGPGHFLWPNLPNAPDPLPINSTLISDNVPGSSTGSLLVSFGGIGIPRCLGVGAIQLDALEAQCLRMNPSFS